MGRSDQSIYLTWSSPIIVPTNNKLNYEVTVYENTCSSISTIKTIKTANTSTDIQGLTPEQQYCFSVRVLPSVTSNCWMLESDGFKIELSCENYEARTVTASTTPTPDDDPCDPFPCGDHAKCQHSNGQHTCLCLPGYQGNPYTTCQKIYDLEGMNTAITGMNTDITGMDTAITGMELDITDLRGNLTTIQNLPYINVCGYQRETDITSWNIIYDKLLLSSTNTVGGGLDISTGIFTAPTPGDYHVSWDLRSSNNNGDEWVEIYLHHNKQRISASKHSSNFNIYDVSSLKATVYVDDQGGRTMMVHLAKGDSVSLFCQDCSAFVGDITFCVSLITPTTA